VRSRRPADTACLRRPSWPQLPIWGSNGGCPAAWLRVAASGCLSEFLVRRALPPSQPSLSVVIDRLVPARPQCRSCVVLGAIASMVCASPAPPDALGPWWACQAQTALAHAQLGIPAPSDHRPPARWRALPAATASAPRACAPCAHQGGTGPTRRWLTAAAVDPVRRGMPAPPGL
jgi:hypothetical protein